MLLDIGLICTRKNYSSVGVDITTHMNSIHAAPLTLPTHTLIITAHILDLRGREVTKITARYGSSSPIRGCLYQGVDISLVFGRNILEYSLS